MPIYEYACASCGHDFERLMRIGADAPPCPECESGEVTKKVSASGFILKGGGWYKDHYGLKGGSSGTSDSSNAGAGSDKSSSSSSSSEGGGSTSSDTKPSGTKTTTTKSTSSSSGD